MDLLDSILNSMDKPPCASDAQKKEMKKQKEIYERKQNEEKNMLIKFRKSVEEKIFKLIDDSERLSIQFEPMDNKLRAIIRDVAEIAGLQVYSFGQEGVDRYPVVYKKENGPCEDEITVRRSGGEWSKEKANEMVQIRLANEKYLKEELEEIKNKRKRGAQDISGTFYKQKYAHLIGEDAALDAAKRTNMNKSYGEVPSENKKDLRSIEQTMADIKAKKLKRFENDIVEGSSHE